MVISRSVSHNAIVNVAQAVLGTILIFVLYRYVNMTLGVAKLGVWSVLLATVSTTRFADFGLSTAVTRFVALNLAQNNDKEAGQSIETGVVSLSLMVALILLCSYPVILKFIKYLFDNEYLSLVFDLLPYAFISIWLSIIASAIHGGLDGCQKMTERATLVIISQVIMLVLSFILIPSMGLVGLAIAQILQGVLLIVGGWIILKFSLPSISFFPQRFNMPVFKKMLGYGTNIQIASMATLLFDPLTKILMLKFGGAASAGYFEIANQAVSRVRALIVMANQAIVPRVTQISELEPYRLPSVYEENFRIIIFISVPIYSILLIFSGLLSQLLLGIYNAQFILFVQFCVVAWLFNTLAAPAYFMNMGIGKVRMNTASQILVGSLNLIFGWILGILFGANGVIFAYVLAITIGAIFLIIFFQYRQGISYQKLNLNENFHLAFLLIAVYLLELLCPNYLIQNSKSSILTLFCELIFLLLILISVLAHPLRATAYSRIFKSKNYCDPKN